MASKKARKLEKQAVNKTFTPAPPSSQGMMLSLVIISSVLPFIFSDKTLDPVISTRYLALTIFVLVFSAYFFLLRKMSFPNPLTNNITRAVFITGILYCLWTVYCLTQAINSKESVFETARSFTDLLLLAIVMITVTVEKPGLSALFKTLTIVALFHSLIGILQYYDIAFTNLPGNFKPYGLMANRNLFGSAQVLVLPFCIYTFFIGNKVWKLVSGIAILGITLSVVLSQTRAAWLSEALIIIGSLVLVMISSPENRKKWVMGTVIGLALAGLISLLAIASDPSGELQLSLKERGASLAKPISESTETMATSTANERLIIWNKTLQLIKDNPWNGVGPGNWKIGIQKYGNAGLINDYGNYVLDHAHNMYLQLTGERGIPGLLFFLAFWILVVFAAFKTILKAKGEDKILAILLLMGLGAFALDGLFSFPLERIEHSYYFVLMGGIVLGIYNGSNNNSKPVVITRPLAIIPLALAAILFSIGKAKHDFELHSYRVKAFNKQNQFKDVINEVEAGKSSIATLDINADPLEMYSAIAYKELKQYPQALVEAQQAVKYHPFSARIYNTIGTIYTEMQDFKKAIPNYEKAISYTALNEVTLKNLAINYYNVQNYQKCLETLSKVKIDKEPILVQVQQDALAQLKKK